MKTAACTLAAAVLACLAVQADDVLDPAVEQQAQPVIVPSFHEVGPRRSVLVGLEVYLDKFFNNDVVHGVRPIFLNAQGREQLGAMHGKDANHAPIRLKAKKGYAVGAIVVKTGFGVDGLSVTFMKLDKGMLDPNQSYESEWVGGPRAGRLTRLGGMGNPAVGLAGVLNNNSELSNLALILSKKPIATAPDKQSPVPDGDAQAKALKMAKEVYGEEWTAAKTANEKRALAQKLLHAADESENDLPSRYVLLKLARDVAIQASDGLLAFDAIDQMVEQFKIDDVEMKAGVLTTFSKRAKSLGDHKSIGDQAVGLIDGAIAHDNIELAVKLSELAMPEARSSRDADLIREVKSRGDECRALMKAYHEMKEAAAVLDKKPDDPAANLAVGKYYCLRKGDWEKGLPMLALGQDERLKTVAGQEIAGANTAADKVKLGDAWWDLAEKEPGKAQSVLRGRANYWYQQALPDISGLAKAKLEKRIKECTPATETPEEPAAVKKTSKFSPGLVAQYYNDTAFRVSAKTQVDENVDFDWNFDSPAAGVNIQNYSIRWWGYLKAPKAGHYTIHARGHQDCQVMIDNNLLIANPVLGRRASDQQAAVTLTAGYHLLVVQFVHSYGQASIHIGWQPPGAASWTAIPPQNLFHDRRQEQNVGLAGH